jgi:hypothetical protein
VSLSIEMTLRGVLLAGKWRDEAGLKTMSDGDCRNTLIVELGKHSRHHPENYYQGFPYNDELIGRGAVVVFLSQAMGYSIDKLKTMSDADQRKALVEENYKHTGIPVDDFQNLTNQELVLLGLNRALIIINVTPLPLELMGRKLNAFAPLAWPFPSKGSLQSLLITDASTGGGVITIRPQSESPRTRIIDTAFLRNSAPGRTDEYGKLEVTNDTAGIVSAWLLGARDESCVGQIGPGQKWTTPVNYSQLWQFRSAFSDEILGMFMTPGGGGQLLNFRSLRLNFVLPGKPTRAPSRSRESQPSPRSG